MQKPFFFCGFSRKRYIFILLLQFDIYTWKMVGILSRSDVNIFKGQLGDPYIYSQRAAFYTHGFISNWWVRIDHVFSCQREYFSWYPTREKSTCTIFCTIFADYAARFTRGPDFTTLGYMNMITLTCTKKFMAIIRAAWIIYSPRENLRIRRRNIGALIILATRICDSLEFRRLHFLWYVEKFSFNNY